MNENNNGLLIVLAIGAFVLYSQKGGDRKPDPAPTPSPVQPAADVVVSLGDVRRLASKYPDAAKALAPLYAAAVRIAERSDISSYQQFTNALVAAEVHKVGLNSKISMGGEWDAVRSAFFDSQMGQDAIGMDAKTRAKLVDSVKAICWGLENPK